MRQPSRRPEQVAGTIRQVIADALAREVRDPRVGFVTVTGVLVTNELSHARVMVSVPGGEAEKAKAVAPRSGAVREVLGLALYGLGRWQDALTELKAYKRISGRTDQNHLIADSLRGLGRPAEAVPLAEEVLRVKGVASEAKAEAVIVAASALADQGRFAEALAFLGRAKTREDVAEGYTLRLWYVKGDILERAGRRKEAAEQFRRIMRHDASAYDVAERLAAIS